MEVYNTNPSSKHCVHPDPYAQFIPNDEWKEIERLLEIEKLYGEEYEEYKKEEAKSPEQKQKEAKELHDLFYGKPTLPSFRKNRTIRINGVKYKIKDLSKLKSL
jgi:hypothetical protein